MCCVLVDCVPLRLTVFVLFVLQGTMVWANGKQYKGAWKQGKRNGYVSHPPPPTLPLVPAPCSDGTPLLLYRGKPSNILSFWSNVFSYFPWAVFYCFIAIVFWGCFYYGRAAWIFVSGVDVVCWIFVVDVTFVFAC